MAIEYLIIAVKCLKEVVYLLELLIQILIVTHLELVSLLLLWPFLNNFFADCLNFGNLKKNVLKMAVIGLLNQGRIKKKW